MKLLFVLDKLETLELEGDTSYALMREACRRDYIVWTCQPGHLGLEHDEAIARCQMTYADDDGCEDENEPEKSAAEVFSVHERVSMPLDLFDMVFMRADPPLDVSYLHATWILSRARGKTLLVNDPSGIRELNEHLSILNFPDLIPPTIVTRDVKRLQEFLEEQDGAIVVKPIDGFAGRGVFVVRTNDLNTSSIFETAIHHGQEWTMAQRYLSEAVEGDKRILLVDGELIGAVLRVPPEHEARGNLHVGAEAVETEIDEADKKIVAAVAPLLKKHGIVFAGIDVIGGKLTEINITSPTGIRHIDALEGGFAAAKVLDGLQKLLPDS